MPDAPSLRRLLFQWYDRCRRDLPWRRTKDPWRILLSEVMLQQTRVQSVLPYYERFLARYPRPEDLASAPEPEFLALWSGLGYYARARNLRRAAASVAERGSFPNTYDEIRALPGVGDYTAAAVASIAFDLPHAVLDGNVARVAARLTLERGDLRVSATRARLQAAVQGWLDPRRPGDFNQALMELGATLCLPRKPQCPKCPLQSRCEANRQGLAEELPVRLRPQQPERVLQNVLVVERAGKLLMRQRPGAESRMPGFWELPDGSQLPAARPLAELGSFRHSITRFRFQIRVVRASLPGRPPASCAWVGPEQLPLIPLTTACRKALLLAGYAWATTPGHTAVAEDGESTA